MPRARGRRLGTGVLLSVVAHAIILGAILWHPVVHIWVPPQRQATVAILMTKGQGDQPAAGTATRPKPASEPAVGPPPSVAPAPKPPAPAPPAPKPPTPSVATAAPPAPPRVAPRKAAPVPPEAAKSPPPRPPSLPMEFGSIGGPSFEVRRDADHALDVSTKPDNTNLAPIYPPEAVRRHEEGTVALVLHVAADGFVDRVDITQSSGYPLLDQAAVSRLRTWHFTPATRGGMPVASSYKIAITFGP